MKKLYGKLSFLFLLSIVVFTSCGNDNNNAPNVNDVKVDYTSHAFYKDFAALDVNKMSEGLNTLKAKYPEFLDFYLDTLAGFGFNYQYSDTNQFLKDFLTHKDFRGLLDTVNKAFTDTKETDKNLKLSFQYIKHYDSSFSLPTHVYYFVSGLNGFTAVYQNEKNIGIGLDLFLGPNFAPYASIGMPEYGTIKNSAENIPVWVCEMIYRDKYTFQYEDRNFLDLIIQKGKELYFLKKVTPYLNDEVRLGYTPAQMKWATDNEAMIYNFFLQNKLMFETNLQKTMRFVTAGPNTAGMPAESPGNIGSYIGFKIVSSYMNNTNTTMHELLELKDPQKILEGAKYKP